MFIFGLRPAVLKDNGYAALRGCVRSWINAGWVMGCVCACAASLMKTWPCRCCPWHFWMGQRPTATVFKWLGASQVSQERSDRLEAVHRNKKPHSRWEQKWKSNSDSGLRELLEFFKSLTACLGMSKPRVPGAFKKQYLCSPTFIHLFIIIINPYSSAFLTLRALNNLSGGVEYAVWVWAPGCLPQISTGWQRV